MANTPDQNPNLLREPPIILPIERPVDDHPDAFGALNLKARITKNLNERITSIDYGQNSSFVQREIDRRYRDLPAAKLPEGNIKFLGSSYSGADIKVIAHMYDQKNITDEIASGLERRQAIAQTIVEACDSLLNGGLAGLASLRSRPSSYEEKRRLFLFAASLSVTTSTEEEQEARDILLGNVFKNSNFTFIGVAKMQRKAEAMKQYYGAESTELKNKLEDLGHSDKEIESSSTIPLGTLQTISVQTFREKNAVRALGHSYAKGYTRGTRTIGGSCIFTIFNENALAPLIRGMASSTTYGERDTELSTLIPDQLPPLDLTIAFANEYGALSDFRLYGVEFFTDGSVFSIEDLLSEETMNFVCRDADIMTSRGRISISRLQRGMHNGKDDKDKSGSSLLFDNQDYYSYLDRLGVRRRLLNR